MNYFEANVNGIPIKIKTENSIFSPNHIDKGTLHMISVVELNPDDKVLDLGCGSGIVGIYCAKVIGDDNVVMIDNDPLSVEVAQKNAIKNDVSKIKTIVSDGFKDVNDHDFTIILSNPPYHTNFSVAKHFIEKGYNHLLIGGVMYMVTKRKEWYKNKLIAIFGGVKIYQVDDYYVFKAIKKKNSYAKTKK